MDNKNRYTQRNEEKKKPFLLPNDLVSNTVLKTFNKSNKKGNEYQAFLF